MIQDEWNTNAAGFLDTCVGGRRHEVSLLIKHAYSRGEGDLIDMELSPHLREGKGLVYRAVKLV